MIEPSTIKFLKGIKKHNDKEWFEENKAVYKVARAEFVELLGLFALEIAKFDPAVAKAIKQKKEVVKTFRIYRDVRFSKNKTKYKTNLSGYVTADLKNPDEPVYYMSIQPGENSFFGGGLFSPERMKLNDIRDRIEADPKDIFKLAKNAEFKKYFKLDRRGALKTAPRGYDIEHEAIEYLRLKSFTAGMKVSDQELKNPKLIKELAKPAKALYQLVNFIRT
jgi:uncharacterized protein (TIGR02453 family)